MLGRVIEQGKRARQHDGGADPLQGAGRDQRADVGREPAQPRRHGEDADPHEIDAARPVAVAQEAPDQQQDRKDQGITVDDPLQGRDAATEAHAQAWQGHVDDRRVELDQREADTGRGLAPVRPVVAVRRMLRQSHVVPLPCPPTCRGRSAGETEMVRHGGHARSGVGPATDDPRRGAAMTLPADRLGG